MLKWCSSFFILLGNFLRNFVSNRWKGYLIFSESFFTCYFFGISNGLWIRVRVFGILFGATICNGPRLNGLELTPDCISYYCDDPGWLFHKAGSIRLMKPLEYLRSWSKLCIEEIGSNIAFLTSWFGLRLIHRLKSSHCLIWMHPSSRHWILNSQWGYLVIYHILLRDVVCLDCCLFVWCYIELKPSDWWFHEK